MELICPTCKATISPENVNITSDIAKCAQCNSLHKASELAENKPVINLPHSSKITLKKGSDDSIEIIAPPKGFNVQQPLLSGTIVWIVFLVIITWLISQSSNASLFMLLPFWAVGFMLMVKSMNAFFETQTIKISKTTLTIKKARPIRDKNIEIMIKDIQAVRLQDFKTNVRARYSKTYLPVVIGANKTEYFFENATRPEQEWVTTTLDKIIKRING